MNILKRFSQVKTTTQTRHIKTTTTEIKTKSLYFSVQRTFRYINCTPTLSHTHPYIVMYLNSVLIDIDFMRNEEKEKQTTTKTF